MNTAATSRNPKKAYLACLLAGAAFLTGGSCASRPHHQPTHHAVAPVSPPTLADTAPKDFPGLHNVVAFHDGYYSGSVPEGEAGFDTLLGMGVKTIISVDGAVPEVDVASQRGMRYIHLPIAYNGFDTERKLELVRATRDALAQGSVYIHCHHGKHRSAGAAGTVVASLGWATPEAMVARMKVSGTAPTYTGLYACTANATVLPDEQVNAVSPHFPSVSPPEGFVKSMVEIDEHTEHLKAIEKAGWATPSDHPDLVPAAEAGRLADLLRLCSSGERATGKDAEFREQLVRNSDQAQALEDALAAGSRDMKDLSAKFAAVTATCKSCHARYRD